MGLTLGEEGITLGGRLAAAHQFAKQLAFDAQALSEGQVHGCFDAADVEFRCQEATELAGIGLAEVSENFRLTAGGLDLAVVVAHLDQGTALGHGLAGKGDGTFLQLAFFDQLIDQAHGQGLLGRGVTT